MKYKAIITDLDGTAIVNHVDASPTVRVTDAIKKAQKKVHVAVATSRPLFIARRVIHELGVNAPCGINDATQLYDPIEDRVIETFALTHEEADVALEFFKEKNLRCMVNAGETEEWYTGGELPETICGVCAPEIPIARGMKLKDELSSLAAFAVQTPPSFQKGNVWISVTSASATKLRTVTEICKLLRVEPQEVIGVGDGYNDFPLLSACGLKIAMGNAIDELKAIADFVAPTVEEDGLAVVIEKFILKT